MSQENPLIQQIICAAGSVSLVAAPGIIQEIFQQVSPNRVQLDVSGKFQKIGVFLTENGLVPPLEEMAPGPLFQVEIPGVSKLQALHDFGKRGFADFDQKVNMGGHKDIGVKEKG